MATGVGMGFDLDALDKAIVKADNNLRKLAQDAEVQSKRISDAFSIGATKGISQFVKEIANARGGISKLMAEDAEFKFTANGAKGFSAKVIDEINKVINYSRKEFENLNATITRSMLIKPTLDVNSIKELENRLVILNQGLATGMLGQGKGKKKIAVDDDLRVRINDEIKAINERLSLLRMSTAQFNQMKAQEATAIINNVKLEQEAIEAGKRRAQEAIQNYKRELDAARNAYRERKQMYEQLFKEQEKQMSQNRRASYKLDVVGGTGMNAADQALRYADRIYSDRGLRSVNNMQKAIQQMQQAQNRLNLNTEEGKKKYEELGQKIKQVEKDLEHLNTRAKSFGDIMKKVGYSVGVYFSISAMKNFGKKLVDVTKEFERQKVALQNLLQNKDEANRLWEKTVALAIKSPYTTQQLVTYTKQLAAYRIEHDKLYETTKMLADVSSGLGVEMNRMILAFGQVKAATYLRATELRQFTEAGVNMLDELARLYTELEGVEVKAGDVFERITKRQVVFSDVEEVFERLTSKGGMFFRMQETQAQTLYGQWANLQDIYQVSLDEMGRSVRGGMVFVISTLRTIVENWRLVATAIESVGTAWVAIKIGNWISTLNKADRAARMLAVTFGNLRKIMLSWQGAAGVLGVLSSVLYNYISNLSQVNQRYVDLRRGTIDNSIAFEQLAEKVEKNNEAIEMYDKLLKDSTKTEEEINNIQKERNKVIGENNKLLAETKSKYEDLLPYVQENANGTLNFDKAVQVMQNRERAYLILQQKAKATLLRDALDTNIGDWREEYNEAEEALIEYQTKLNDAIAKGNIFELQGDQLVDLRELYKYIKDVKSIEEFQKALSEMPEGMKSFAMYNKYAKELRGELGDVVGDFSKVSSFFIDNAHVVSEALHGIDKDLTLGVGEAAEVEQKKAGEAFDKLLERLGVVDEEVIKKIHEYVNSISKEKFNIVLDFNYKTDEERELLDWQKRYNEFIEKLTEGKNVAELRKISSFEIETDNKIKELDEYIKDQENIINRGGTKEQQRYTQEEIDKATELLAVLKEARNWFGKNSKETKKEESEELKRLKEQIRLVRQLADDYEEMWKKYGKAYADANIKSDARTNAFAELELDIENFAVGSRQDEKNNLRKLLEKALGIEGGKVEVEKAIADVEVEVRWSLQEQANADLSRDIENLFGNYEMSLELEKLNIPKDLASQLFGVEAIDLTSLRKQLLDRVGLGDMAGKTNTEILDSDAYTNLNEHQRKELADHLQKVSQMEQKEQEERLKKYIAFSRKAMSERAKIKLEELQTIAEIEKTFAIKEGDSEEVKAVKLSERTRALAQARKDASDALQKLDWEAFKSSDTFNNIFDDLEHASDEVLKNVIQQLKDFKNQWKDMPFEQMRQVVDLLNKAEGALEESSNPFMEGTRLNKVIRKDGRTAQEAQLDIWQAEQQKRIAEEALSNYEIFEKVSNGQLKVAELSTEQQKEYAYWQDISVEQREELVGKIQNEVSAQNEAINKSNIHLNNIKKQKTSYEAQAQAIEQMNQMAQDLYNSFKGLHEALGGDSDSPEAIFAEMGMSVTNSVASMIQLQLELQAASVSATAFGAAMNTALGVIGWINMGVSVLTSVITAFTKAHDNKREKQIQKELDLVERLGKLYEKLEKQIEAAYSIDTFQAANDAAKDNLEQQIRATERMIEAEKDKKKTDQKRIDEWREQIDENLELLEELEAKRLQELGGIGGEDAYKDIAQGFTDAWFDAFLETGNGLDALNDHFDEVLNNMVKKQLTLRATDSFLAPIFEEIDKAVKDTRVTNEEMQKIKELAAQTMPELAAFLENIATEMGMSEYAGKNGELSGLSAGISGITETQADIISAYLNTLRFYVADSNMQLKALVAAQGVNADTPNPMLSQLLVIAEQTRSIRDMFESVIGRGGNNKHGGAYLKVDIG